MSQTHPYLLLIVLLGAAGLTLTIWGLYSVARGLYSNFLDFSRRFRGVE